MGFLLTGYLTRKFYEGWVGCKCGYYYDTITLTLRNYKYVFDGEVYLVEWQV